MLLAQNKQHHSARLRTVGENIAHISINSPFSDYTLNSDSHGVRERQFRRDIASCFGGGGGGRRQLVSVVLVASMRQRGRQRKHFIVGQHGFVGLAQRRQVCCEYEVADAAVEHVEVRSRRRRPTVRNVVVITVVVVVVLHCSSSGGGVSGSFFYSGGTKAKRFKIKLSSAEPRHPVVAYEVGV